MTDPHHETALMLLRAVNTGTDDADRLAWLNQSDAGSYRVELYPGCFLAMAAAVDAKMEAREKVLREALKAAHDAIAQIQSEYILGGYCQELLGAAEELVDAALEAKP